MLKANSRICKWSGLHWIPDRFIEHGSIKEQREEVGLTVENVCAELRKMAAVHNRERLARLQRSPVLVHPRRTLMQHTERLD